MKLRKNLENTNSFAQVTYREVMDIKACISRIESNQLSMGTQLQKATFQSAMRGTDISEFFPVDTHGQLEAFMDRDHPEWNSRREEFFNLLYSITTSVKKGFARGLIKALFSRQYISKSKWPSYG